MTITLSPQIEAKLLEKAQQEGQDLDTLVDIILADSLGMQTREDEEIAAAIRKAMAAGEAGREKPIGQYLAEQRAKRGLPASWPSRDSVQETTPGHFINTSEYD
ncbi:MAG: hypothetical protein ACRYFS_25830 [Janthinobacterium lividum]